MHCTDYAKGFVCGILASIATTIVILLAAFVSENMRMSEIDKELTISVQTAKEYDRDDINAVLNAFDSSDYNIKRYKCGQFGCSATFTKLKNH